MFFTTNLRHLRHTYALTQEALAEKLNLSLKQIGSYEEGRATPKLDILVEMANFFSITLEQFINQDLRLQTGSTLHGMKAYAEGERLRVLSISQDQEENEYIELVRSSSEQDYIKGYADIDYVGNLPKCMLPSLPKNHTYRAFEISDGLPATIGSHFMVGEFVADWNKLKNQEGHIIISRATGIVFRKINNQIAESNTIVLEDINGRYASFQIGIEEVEEIWRFAAFVSLDFPQTPSTVNELQETMMRLQKQLNNMEVK